ncbi:MAG: hypothetical protein N3D84_03360 [Candidatus Woesearchaeota archaeon]|nr:hypothetical protein [Candidatus Woesearchaeota archaeon]
MKPEKWKKIGQVSYNGDKWDVIRSWDFKHGYRYGLMRESQKGKSVKYLYRVVRDGYDGWIEYSRFGNLLLPTAVSSEIVAFSKTSEKNQFINYIKDTIRLEKAAGFEHKDVQEYSMMEFGEIKKRRARAIKRLRENRKV